jgi:hypothetical protein
MHRPALAEGWCLRNLGNGSFSQEGVYQWPPEVRQRCGFRMHSTGAARRLLRGRHVVFIGNSVQRRAMYALADLLGGDNATRLPKMPVLERIFDQKKGYHDFQHQRIDLTDGRAMEPVQGLDYCGVDSVLFECGTVRWGSSPSADEWRSSPDLGGWANLLEPRPRTPKPNRNPSPKPTRGPSPNREPSPSPNPRPDAENWPDPGGHSSLTPQGRRRRRRPNPNPNPNP